MVDVEKIIAYELGELDTADTLELFAELILTGQAWTLQGSYGRSAKSLIDSGYISPKGKVLLTPEEIEESDRFLN